MITNRRTTLVAALIAGSLLASGCGSDENVSTDTTFPDATSDSGAAGGIMPAEGETIEVTGYVLESPDHGPQLCDAIRESYPPQCSGDDLVGFSWDDVDDEESANGTTWGYYTLTGHRDGDGFVLDAPPRSAATS